MKYSIGDIIYSPASCKHALITDYVFSEFSDNVGDIVYQLLCLEDGETYIDASGNTDKYCIKVA